MIDRTNTARQRRYIDRLKARAGESPAHHSRHRLFLPRGQVHQPDAAALSMGGWGIQWMVAIYTDPDIGLKPTTVILPKIRDGIAGWVREIVFVDWDGDAAEAPITIVSAPGEPINGRSETSINSEHGVARLLICAGDEDVPDRWFLG